MELLYETKKDYIGKSKQRYAFGMFKCPVCGKEKEYRKTIGLRQRFCSKKCSGIAKTGIRRGAYKRKIMVSKYYYLYKPEHPKAIGTKKLYVAEHRIVVEEALGRYLTDKEVVHHKNEDTLDNRLENLEVMTMSDHIKHHIKERKRKNGQFKK